MSPAGNSQVTGAEAPAATPYCLTPPYSTALEELELACGAVEGMLCLTGDTGTGKTALCAELTARLRATGHTVIVFPEPPGSVLAMEQFLLQALGLPTDRYFSRTLTRYLQQQETTTPLVVWFDDVEQLPVSVCIAIRLLAGIQDARTSLVRVILSGTEAFRQRLLQPDCRSFAQQIGCAVVLAHMNEAESADFAALVWPTLHPDAPVPDSRTLHKCYRASRGKPRALLELLREMAPVPHVAAESGATEAVVNAPQPAASDTSDASDASNASDASAESHTDQSITLETAAEMPADEMPAAAAPAVQQVLASTAAGETDLTDALLVMPTAPPDHDSGESAQPPAESGAVPHSPLVEPVAELPHPASRPVPDSADPRAEVPPVSATPPTVAADATLSGAVPEETVSATEETGTTGTTALFPAARLRQLASSRTGKGVGMAAGLLLVVGVLWQLGLFSPSEPVMPVAGNSQSNQPGLTPLAEEAPPFSAGLTAAEATTAIPVAPPVTEAPAVGGSSEADSDGLATPTELAGSPEATPAPELAVVTTAIVDTPTARQDVPASSTTDALAADPQELATTEVPGSEDDVPAPELPMATLDIVDNPADPAAAQAPDASGAPTADPQTLAMATGPADSPDALTSPALATPEEADSDVVPARTTTADPQTARPAPVAAAPPPADIAAVRRFIDQWLQDWQQQAVEAYLAAYDSSFRPAYVDSLDEWRMQRERNIRSASNIKLTLSEFSSEPLATGSDGIVRVRLRFWLAFRSSTYADNTLKELVVADTSEGWRILEERNLQVDVVL